MSKPRATTSDIDIGKRIRIRRQQLCMNQTELADRLGIAYQQIQKYENGADRISASRLWQIAATLDVHVGFFHGADDAAVGVDTAVAAGTIGLLAERHAIELLACFRAMTMPQRSAFLEIARAITATNATVGEAEPSAEQDKPTRCNRA